MVTRSSTGSAELTTWKDGRLEPCTLAEFIEGLRRYSEWADSQFNVRSDPTAHLGGRLSAAADALEHFGSAAQAAPEPDDARYWEFRKTVENFVFDPIRRGGRTEGEILNQLKIMSEEHYAKPNCYVPTQPMQGGDKGDVVAPNLANVEDAFHSWVWNKTGMPIGMLSPATAAELAFKAGADWAALAAQQRASNAYRAPDREAVAVWILRERGMVNTSIESIKEYRGETWLKALADADAVLALPSTQSASGYMTQEQIDADKGVIRETSAMSEQELIDAIDRMPMVTSTHRSGEA